RGDDCCSRRNCAGSGGVLDGRKIVGAHAVPGRGPTGLELGVARRVRRPAAKTVARLNTVGLRFDRKGIARIQAFLTKILWIIAARAIVVAERRLASCRWLIGIRSVAL